MKNLCLLLCATILAGCAGAHRQGVSRVDAYDAVEVDQMVGNNVSGQVFQKTILCLNGRRETRPVTSVTNVQVTAVTNVTVISVTNQTIALSTNFQFTAMTNLAPQVPVVTSAPSAEGAAPVETNALVLATNAPAAVTTNFSLSLANNQSGTASPSQSSVNNQLVRTLNNQITSTSNNLTVSLMTNLVVTGETNQVVNYVTNYSIVSLTNVHVTATNGVARDYFLFTELTPPPDFTAGPGENLVLLVDGTRYGFTPVPPSGGFSSRKGFSSTLYRVPPEVLVAIANAEEVWIRLRGTSTTIDRVMNESSRANFKKFMLKFFQNPPEPEVAPGGANTASAAPAPAADHASLAAQ